MTHHLKTLPEYFQAVISGTKPFEIRNNDRGFKPGDSVILEEFSGYQDIPACPDFGANCPPVEYDPYNEQDYHKIPEDCRRHCCGAYRKELYTGRKCLIKIKDSSLTLLDLPVTSLSRSTSKILLIKVNTNEK